MNGVPQGEFALIARIIERLGDAAAHDILIPPGDDAAAWTPASPAVVATTDVLAEGNHWRANTMSMEDVGWRAIATNVSDLAAMGAAPQIVLIAAVLGPAFTTEDMDHFVDGVAASCRIHDVRVAGGDIVRGGATAFAVTAFGTARLDRNDRALVLRRDTAKIGDVVAVSGTPGAAAAGLAAIEAARTDDPAAEALVRAHRRPLARVALGQAAIVGGVACAIDISDGLLQDLGHIAERSGVGIEIDLEALPLDPGAVALFEEDRARDFALGGGEDYELALVGRAEALDALSIPLTHIGRVVGGHTNTVVVRRADGSSYQPPSVGWDQLRAGSWPSA